jgi:transcriptional regulator GlxA family with amidase domain
MQIAIGLYPEFTALDAIGPYQVLTQVPGAEVVLCAARTGRLSDDNGLLHLDIEHTFADVARPDVLLVPGGFITRRLARDRDPIVDWIADAHEHTTSTTSVCTGALLLGAAGILDGLDATTHWYAYDELAGYGARPTEQRVVQQGKVWTAAGVSAGIDLALTLVAEHWGPEVAQAIQLGIEYDPQPPFDSGAPSKADPEILALVRAISAEKEAAVRAG